MQKTRLHRVIFADDSLKDSFDGLKSGKFEDQKLYNSINRTIGKLKETPFSGTRMPKRLWPKEYIKKYKINNLWKYNLPEGWRIIYAIRASELEIISIIIEWFSHKDYEKRFGYD